MLENITPPPLIRLLNLVGNLADKVGIELFSITPKALFRVARRRTGLTDLAEDSTLTEATERLCNSIREEANLTTFGRYGVREMILGGLEMRLQFIAHKKQHEDRFNTRLRPPLMVLGLPRSGTTLLHRLLSLAEETRSLSTWEVQRPLPPVGKPDHRRRDVAFRTSLAKKVAPQLMSKHPLEIDAPEEDFFLMDTTLHSPTVFFMAPVPSYFSWLKRQDFVEPYSWWAQILRFLQSETPDRRFTLKAPFHTAFMDQILEAVPNMQFVHIHRDPVEVVGSMNSLMHTTHAMVSKTRDPITLGSSNLDFISWLASENLEMRADKELPLVDVYYRDLIANPVETVARIHQHFEIPFSSQHKARIRDWLDNKPKEKHGKHDYSLEECGLDRERVYERFPDYMNRFFNT